MIKFLSLYLGLVTGVQPVEVVVGAEVASVELRLDGAQVGVLTSTPWRLKVDFGPRLVPRRLVAVAYDDARREIGRTEQFVNLPRAKAEAGIVLERDGAGAVTAARVTWQSGRRQLRFLVFKSRSLIGPGEYKIRPYDKATATPTVLVSSVGANLVFRLLVSGTRTVAGSAGSAAFEP